MALIYIYVFVIGLCIGSFINVLLWRLGKKKGIVTGRSECPKCSGKLDWYDLIPVLSFILLNGKCRHCNQKISVTYPIVEMITGLVFFLVIFAADNIDLSLLIQFLTVSLLLILAFFDYFYHLLPNKITATLFIVIIGADLLFKRAEFWQLFSTALIISVIFGIIYLISKGRWMGFGDVKFVFLIGLLFGYPLGYLAVTAAIWLAALIGMVLIALRKAKLKTALPFGTFLAVVSIAFIIFQHDIQIFRYLF